MQLPLSPLFPLVSSTDSKQSIRTSPGLIFICLKKGKIINFRPFLFPALLFSVFCSVHYAMKNPHMHTNQVYIHKIIPTLTDEKY